MMPTGELFDTAKPPEEARRAEYDVDYTPRAIPRAVFRALAPELGDVRRILIPAAGAGSWAAEARARWPDALIVGVEIREEERENLRRWCNVVHIMDARDLVGAADILAGQYDLIADNPPFSLLPISFDCDHPRMNKNGDRCAVCKVRKSQAETLRAFVVGLRPLLAQGGRLVLYHVSQLGQRGKESGDILREHVPLYQMRHQPVGHRANRGHDSKSHSTWVWGPDQGLVLKKSRRSRAWLTWDMPALPAHERRWSVVPGTEAT